MKNFLFSFLFLFFFNVVLSQNPNNHWQLGNSDINFSTNPPTVTTAGVSSQYGTASISDANGDLLFYTDGQKVWNKNHTIMTNGAEIGYNGVINTVIVPNRANPNQFFIIKSEQHLCLCLNPDPTYYLYSIVEFNELNPLGIVLQINNSNSVGPGNSYSKVLSDSSGNIINSFHFGPLTVSKNDDNNSYWVIVQSSNKILSYKIDENGFNFTPIESSFLSSQTYAHGIWNSVYGFISGIEGADFKITPNNKALIGLQYSRLDPGTEYSEDNSSDPTNPNFKNFFYKLDFNANTGKFSNYQLLTGTNRMVYEFEISKSSNNLFFTRFRHPSAFILTPNSLDGEVVVKNLLDNSVPVRILNEFGTNTPSSKLNYIQRDKFDNLLLSSFYTDLNRNKYIHKIDNQDSFVNASVVVNAIYLNGNSIGKLPQLIPELTLPCPNTLMVSTTVSSGIDTKQAENYIEATNTINSGSGAIYHAGTSVLLKPMFTAKAGATFRAYIEGCTGDFVARQGFTDDENETSFDTETEEIKEIVTVFPNPNNGIFTLKCNDLTITSIEITDFLGFSIYKTLLKEQDSLEINLQDKPKGIYVLKIVAENQLYTKKIIIN